MGCGKFETDNDLIASLTQLSADIGKLDKFTNGDEGQVVSLGGKDTPSIRNLVHKIKLAADSAVALATAQADRSTQASVDSCACALQAQESVEEALHIVQNIPGFLNNVHAIFGLRLEEGILVCHKFEQGEVANLSEYEFFDVLPVEASFSMVGGSLVLELPFTPGP